MKQYIPISGDIIIQMRRGHSVPYRRFQIASRLITVDAKYTLQPGSWRGSLGNTLNFVSTLGRPEQLLAELQVGKWLRNYSSEELAELSRRQTLDDLRNKNREGILF